MILRRLSWHHLILPLCFLMGCDNLPIAPQPSVHYTGRIIDSKGRPIPEGYMRFEAITRAATALQLDDHAAVDSSGSFAIDLFPGTYRVMWFHSYVSNIYQDYEDTERTVEVSADHRSLDWIVDGVVVQGSMKDPSGAAVDSFGVYIDDERYEAFTSTSTGHYQFYVPRGTYAFVAFGRYGSGIPSQRFGPISVQSDTTLDFQMDGFEVTGSVRGPGSIPLMGALVEARGQVNSSATRSDGAGNYRMYSPPQDIRFFVRPVETWILPQLTASMTIAAPASIDFNVGGTEWTGIVTRSDTGAPVAGAAVTAVLVADDLQRKATATTDALGQFRLAIETGRDFDLFATMDRMESPRISRVAGADSSFALEIIVPTP